MFITSKHNSSALEPNARSMSWPGPRIILVGSDDHAAHDWITSAEVYYLVIDLAASPTSRFECLRIAITRAARSRIVLGGPLLFSNNGIPDKEVERLERAVKQDPWMIEFATDPMDGKFSMLTLGEKIVTNPLFAEFFTKLHEGVTEMQTGSCIAVMKEHMEWRKEGQTG